MSDRERQNIQLQKYYKKRPTNYNQTPSPANESDFSMDTDTEKETLPSKTPKQKHQYTCYQQKTKKILQPTESTNTDLQILLEMMTKMNA